MYGLSTCVHCRRARNFLESNKVVFDCIYVDQLKGAEREKALETVRKHNPRVSFPTVLVDDGASVVIGFQEQELADALELTPEEREAPPLPPLEEARELMRILRPLQEAKGYFFNTDTKTALELLQQLAANKARYGYMSCPCRLASGRQADDRDILCPCVYRAPDVLEYGACYCKLYVGPGADPEAVNRVRIPERRPAEKSLRPQFSEASDLK